MDNKVDYKKTVYLITFILVFFNILSGIYLYWVYISASNDAMFDQMHENVRSRPPH